MPKVLAQAGSSLADVYDVEGSVAGVETLESRDVSLVHEMGATIFSERFGEILFQLSTGALAQSVAWNINITLEPTINRILHYAVVADVTARTNKMQLSISDIGSNGLISTDCPFWSWETGVGTDIDKAINHMLNGSIVSKRIFTSLSPPGPTLASGTAQRNVVNQLAFRGQALPFGAGTVTLTALVLVGQLITRGVSSKGLPLPGW